MVGHITSTKTYVTIFFILIVCTLLTYGVWEMKIGGFGVAISIAIFKASLVILYFMHVKWSPVLTKTAVILAVVFLAILLVFTGTDYATRGWAPTATGWEGLPVLK